MQALHVYYDLLCQVCGNDEQVGNRTPHSSQAGIDHNRYVPRPMNHGDDLDRLLFREVDNEIGPNGPEAERRHRPVCAHMPEFWLALEQAKCSGKADHQPSRRFRAVLADVIAYLAQITLNVAAKKEAAHLVTRDGSGTSSSAMSRSITFSPSTLSPESSEARRSSIAW